MAAPLRPGFDKVQAGDVTSERRNDGAAGLDSPTPGIADAGGRVPRNRDNLVERFLDPYGVVAA